MGVPELSRANAARRRCSVPWRRFSCEADGSLLRDSCVIVIPALIEFGENAVAFLDARRCQSMALRVEGGMAEQIGIALTPRRPNRAMLLAHCEVGAAGAGTLCAQHGIRAVVAAQTGRAFTPIDAIAPVACAEPHIGLAQYKIDVFSHVTVARAAPEAAALGDHAARFPSKPGGGQQVLERASRILDRLGIDQVPELEVCADIARVGHDTGNMAEMGGQRVQ